MGFKACYESAGQRGHSYLVHRNYRGEPAFTSQHRAVGKGFGEDLNTTFPVSLITDSRINFCPTCGENLAKFYAKRIDELYRPDLLITEEWPPTD